MTLHNFISKLNWTQILRYFIAFLLLSHAFHAFSYLHDIKFLEMLSHWDGEELIDALKKNGMTPYNVSYFFFWTSIAGFVGLLLAFITSLILSFKRKLFWVNAFIAFLLAYILGWFQLSGWSYIQKMCWYAAQKFDNAVAGFSCNGIILLASGIWLLFSNHGNQSIEKHKPGGSIK